MSKKWANSYLMSDDELVRDTAHKEAELRRLKRDKLSLLKLSPKVFEFINSTLLIAAISGGNQLGKSVAVLLKHFFHMTGLYPSWYKGIRYREPVTRAVAGETALTTKLNITNPLLGPHTDRGSGIVPDSLIDPKRIKTRNISGCPESVLEYELPWHDSTGTHRGWSKAYVYSYAKGWKRVQGPPFNGFDIDEEPEWMFFKEVLARTNYTRGDVNLAFSPLQGWTKVYDFLSQTDTALLINYGVDDPVHLTDEHKQHLKDKWAHDPQRDARLYGFPVVGEGLIYAVPKGSWEWEPQKLPDLCDYLIGVDLPWNKNGYFAAVLLRYNRTTDTIYVVDEFKATELDWDAYADACNIMGQGIPVAWPHDGTRENNGAALINQLKKRGVNTMSLPAFMIDSMGKKHRSRKVIISEITERMVAGTLKVSTACPGILREISQYRLKNGDVARGQDDHLIDALHKGVMMIRFAENPLKLEDMELEDVYSEEGVDYFRDF